MSRLGGVRFHKPKNFRTHMQTSTLGHWKGLSDCTDHRFCKEKRADLPSPSQDKRTLRLPNGYQSVVCVHTSILLLCVLTKVCQSLIIKLISQVFFK